MYPHRRAQRGAQLFQFCIHCFRTVAALMEAPVLASAARTGEWADGECDEPSGPNTRSEGTQEDSMERVRVLRRARQKSHYARKKSGAQQLAASLDAASAELDLLRQKNEEEALRGTLLEKMSSYTADMLEAVCHPSVRHSAAVAAPAAALAVVDLRQLHFDSVDGDRTEAEALILHAAAMHLFSETEEPSEATIR